MSNKGRVCLVGASGRMGQRVIRLLDTRADLQLGAILTHAHNPPVAVPGVVMTESVAKAVAASDVVVDFAAPAICTKVAAACVKSGAAYVVASTGLTDEDHHALDVAAGSIAILQAANLSLGVNVMLELVREAAARLRGFEVEISEIHHRHKRDAPSGTAYALGEAVMQGGGEKTAVAGRHGNSALGRGENELGYSAIRGGEVPGEHTVYFFGDAERLEITHRSASGDIFASGALTAAAWLLAQKPGRYTMRDVLRPGPPAG